MTAPTRPDPAMLSVVQTTEPGQPPPAAEDLKYGLVYRTIDENGVAAYQRVNLCGFSYFQELNGLDPTADQGIKLWSAKDTEVTGYDGYPDELPPPILTGDKFGMTFDYYLDHLKAKKINYSRLWVFPLAAYEYTAYDKDSEDLKHRYDISTVSTAYLERLNEFIEKARDRGIIVCLSLFSSQMLKHDYWKDHPFNVAKNTTGVGHPEKGYIGYEDGSEVHNAFGVFCDVADGSPVANAQKSFVTQIVMPTMPYWNVVYEIFNEPGSSDSGYPITNAAPWIKMVAGWIDDLLKDSTGNRTRLISITALDELIPALMAGLVPEGGSKLVDIFSLHGTQWGGNAGTSMGANDVCKGTHDIPVEIIQTGAGEFEPNPETQEHEMIPRPGMNETIKKFYSDSNYPVALIFDCDSLYWAQKKPANYVQACLEKRASFSYRWGDKFLKKINDSDNCTTSQDCGLDERLTKIAAGQTAAGTDPAHAVTVFPTSPAAVKHELVVTVDETYVNGAYLTVSFGRPDAGPHGEDTTPEGYVAYFGPSMETVGKGVPPFPPSKYFKVADPQHPQFTVAFERANQLSEVFVAVAARNGFLPGEWSNIVQVPIASNARKLNGEVNFDPAKTSLPIGEVATRDFNLRATFINTGEGTWRTGIKDFSDYTISQKLFVLAPAANRPGNPVIFVDLPHDVAPGQEVTFDLSTLVPKPLFPYSRQPIKYSFGMITFVDFGLAGHNYYAFGTQYEKLPDGAELQVSVTNQDQSQPKRRASQIFRKALVIPAGQTDIEILSNAAAHSYELISLACDGKTPSGNPVPAGTIIRADVRLEPDTEHENRLHRVVRISHTSPEPLTVDAWAVMVDKQDLQYEQKVLDYITVFKDKPPLSINLGTLEYKFEIASLYSTQKLKQGAVEYYPYFRSSGATKKRLQVRITGAPADAEAYVQLEMRVVEVLENMGYLQFDSRKHAGRIIVFEPGDGLTQYSKMGDGATHNFQVVSVASIDDVPLRYDIVLRANDSGVFERALEVTRDDTTIAGRVPYDILDVPLDVTSLTARQAASIKQDHAQRILDFFNNAQTADEITYGISDNPAFGPRSRKAFSIRHKLAQRILETRGSLPAGRFESLEQIDEIRGVGKDTFEDIAYTFEDDKSDDRK